MRNLVFFLLIIAGLLVVIVFAALNPGTITVDLAVTEREVPKSLALAVALLAGWLFGLLCAGLVLLTSASISLAVMLAFPLASSCTVIS